MVIPTSQELVGLAVQALSSSPGVQTTTIPLNQLVPVEYRENSPDYQFANPLLFIQTDPRLYPELTGLNAQISASIRAAVNAHKADSVAVYYRDMNSGHWTGVNDTLQFEPSSMLKVAVMIAYLRLATIDSSNSSTSIDSELNQQLYYPGGDSSGQYYKPPVNLPAGNYSIKDLISDMIVNSDNVALDVLTQNEPNEVKKVFRDFRLPDQPTGIITDYMTPRSYAIVFRTLYNSTYLPWSVSDHALQLLASTTFVNGLVAGVPDGTIVAHKFGEHTNVSSTGTPIWKELHDCGIIYYPGRPYLLCVMTSGQDFSKLETVISGISSLVYQYASSLPPPGKN